MRQLATTEAKNKNFCAPTDNQWNHRLSTRKLIARIPIFHNGLKV